MARRSNQKTALADPVRHALVPGIGYVMYDSPLEQLPAGNKPQDDCDPPVGAADGSLHMLKTPAGNELLFTWNAAARAWLRAGGKRVGFAAAYLSSHGWAYAGAASVGKAA